MDDYLRELSMVMKNVSGVRRAGSMALELAYLAAGRIDVFWERGMGAWDAAAGLLLIEEAGGQLWALDGQPWYASSALAASTPGLRAGGGGLLGAV
jgi:myo-inositol-1(or 4)-monophosphatase